MSERNSSPPDTLRLSTVLQAKALAHPLRRRMLRRWAEEELSPIQLANKMEEPPTKLYYHVKLLEDAGLIEMTREEPRRGTRERFYVATSTAFQSADGEPGESAELFVSALRAGQHEVATRLDPLRKDSASDVFLSVSTEVRADSEGLRELSSFLVDWIDRQRTNGDDVPPTYLALASFPVVDSPVSDSPVSIEPDETESRSLED